MRYDWRNNAVLFVHNLGAVPREVRFDAGRGRARTTACWSTCCRDDHSTPDADGTHCILLEPYGYRWFRVGGLDYLLRRTEA